MFPDHYNNHMALWWEAFNSSLVGAVGATWQSNPGHGIGVLSQAYVKRAGAIATLAVEAYEAEKKGVKDQLTKSSLSRTIGT